MAARLRAGTGAKTASPVTQASHSARLAKLVRMKVSELAQRTGVSVHRLRRYEELGLIQAGRGASGYREFSERTQREVVFIAMGRDLGFSLPELAEALPRYRAGTLTLAQMIDHMRGRIAAVDEQIAVQRALRNKLVDHIAWLEQRQREQAQRAQSKTSASWPTARKPRP